jgi:hypothetical protein
MAARRTHLLEVALHARCYPFLIGHRLLTERVYVVSTRSLCGCLVEREYPGRCCERD